MTEDRIPKSRLNQIARRKLLALGIQTRESNDGVSLEGEIVIQPPAQLTNPFNNNPIQRVGFLVEGHDHILMLDPPVVSRMAPQPFFDFDRVALLIDQIAASLSQRAGAVKQIGNRLQDFGLQTNLDPERGMAVTRIELDPMSTAILEGDERGLFAVRVDPRSKSVPSVHLGNIPVNLDEFPHKVDLELHLAHLTEQAQSAKDGPPSRPETSRSSAPTTELAIPAAGRHGSSPQGVSLKLLVSAMGPQAVIGTGLVITRDLMVADQQVRFLARHQEGTTFAGKMSSSKGSIWKGSFDLSGFPGVKEFAAGVLGTSQVSAVSPESPESGLAGTEEEMVLGYQLPVNGEIWVMNLLVEQESESEIRYVGVDIDGKPYGAPRVLPREAFLQAFACVSAGAYRLLVEVMSVELGKVTYTRLGSDRQAAGNPVTVRLAPFVANFVPEAAAY